MYAIPSCARMCASQHLPRRLLVAVDHEYRRLEFPYRTMRNRAPAS